MMGSRTFEDALSHTTGDHVVVVYLGEYRAYRGVLGIYGCIYMYNGCT